ncbi:MAG: hypothetical protein HQK81_05910 [Desulfovibrionaceae bacterium]|nr:hypothetical protein [Desulfovibrionaceae bacterium]MBF0513584.1 hypothetical protein [Desulfovibrionaceae bacterium]
MHHVLIALYSPEHCVLQSSACVLAAAGRRMAWRCLVRRAAAAEPPPPMTT